MKAIASKTAVKSGLRVSNLEALDAVTLSQTLAVQL